ncbi:hypothetical protein L1987_86737 [Smallanthus sonchifolius]|uniref:Uncharacterized protein n=3 Tax=Smallanthus sonchifolius TaxID=185202 RepID=A0ACB8Y0U8_9ASTR|nr:hypothetical protein L1987_86733 [Smallanthus sonchifolius]KAI3677115.1 hypothetical protein L1987_86735 [Smallanthus sonchifolius]KAI3677117.1 hypothetical protein L1987_86737 [Smallanthus sonchifolius]
MLLSLLSKRTLRADFRDAYGFTVRPQYLETFKEFDAIYKVWFIFQYEEEERSTKWAIFLEQYSELGQLNSSATTDAETTEHETNPILEPSGDENVSSDKKPTNDDDQIESVPENVVPEATKTKKPVVRNWAEVRSSLNAIEDMMCRRVKIRKNEKHLQSIQEDEPISEDSKEELTDDEQSDSFPWKELESLVRNGGKGERAPVPEKSKKQIEKDLPRTFPGHPALNEEGRNSLRRLLLAYARHNPDVGYCQGMNFFAAMLLLMMPEENAFWNNNYVILPSVLRIWDVIFFEGNRAMLLRTALALMEIYGLDLGTAMDAGDAIILIQSLLGSTFDSSNLVVTACISFSDVTEDTLQILRQNHRPDVIAAVEERTKGEHLRKSSKGLATKLYSFKQEREPLVRELSMKQGFRDKRSDKDSMDLMSPLKRAESSNIEPFNAKIDSLPDIQDQVIWLKAQLCSMLEDKRSATVRAEELETALMEMAQQDNRLQLSAKVLMKVEQEQKITEDARRSAERDAAAQRYLVSVLEKKYEEAMTSLAQMEKRVEMAESMLEATLQYNSGQVKAQATPGNIRPESVKDNNTTKRTGILPFGLGWRDKNKVSKYS